MSSPRRRFFPHPRFQAAFAFSFVRGVFISVFFPALALFLTVYLLAQDPLVTPLQKSALLQETNRLIIAFFWIVATFAVIFGTFGAYLSYKFVGPIRRIEGWLEQQASSLKTEKLKLRPADELEPMMHILNRLFYR